MVGLSEQTEHFLSEKMKVRKVDLTCNSQALGGMNIKRGKFQGDSLTSIDPVIPLTFLRKSDSVHQFSSNEAMIHHLLFMGD